mmetsp:Transcript_66593/g.168722  ORF Transcript_66593/g.168722 Transcript_66593/m.168722 type:complete len:207 (-) Transcript_66593:54-674(-)
MAWRAPLVAPVGLPGGGREALGGDLRGLVLHELEVGARGEVLVLRQGLQGVRRGRERVHEHECEVRLVLLLHGLNLLRDQIQEAVVVGDCQQRLRLVQAHARSEAAIELQHHSRLEQGRIGRDAHALQRGDRLHGADRALGDEGRLARQKHAVVVLEGRDGCFVEPLCFHLLFVGGPEGLHLGRDAAAADPHFVRLPSLRLGGDDV